MSRAALAAAGHRAAVVIACLALGGAGLIAGCGEDEETTTTPSTTPTIEPATPTGPTGAAGQAGTGNQKPQTEGSDVGLEDGTVTPPPESGTQSSPGAAEDSAENDVPPDSDAEEAFEKYCDENPGACG